MECINENGVGLGVQDGCAVIPGPGFKDGVLGELQGVNWKAGEEKKP